MTLGHSMIREDGPALSRHAEALDERARHAGWRMAVRPAVAARTAEGGIVAGIGVDALADRRAALAQRLERGRAWAVELAGGEKARTIAAREGVSDTWVRFEVLLSGLDAEIVAELLRPGSLAAALSNEALREIARRRTPLAQRALFGPMVRQVQVKAASGAVMAPPVRSGGKASFAFLLARARRWRDRLGEGESMAKIAASERLTRQVVWYWTQVLTLPVPVLEALEQAEDLPGVTLARLVKVTRVRSAEAQVCAFWDLVRGFSCRDDALAAVAPLQADFRFHEVEVPVDRVERARCHARHFVLITDHKDEQAGPDARILTTYREQHIIEGHTGFRWIKGPAAVAPVFIKTPSRVAALGLADDIKHREPEGLRPETRRVLELLGWSVAIFTTARRRSGESGRGKAGV